MSRKPRTKRQLKRRKGDRAPRSCVLIVCEGAKTELQYFERLCRCLRLQPVEVEIIGDECGSDPVSVVREAVNRRRERAKGAKKSGIQVPYDEVWCVLDVEKFGRNPQLPRALDMASQNSITMVLSNPCFEFWILLHFERVGSSFQDCQRVIRKLRDYLPGYQKADPGVFQQVAGQIDDAVKRAKDIMRSQWQHETDVCRKDPSSEVYLLVQRLRQIAEKPYDR